MVIVKEDQRKRTQDDLRVFPMHCLFVSCLSWNPNPGNEYLTDKKSDPDFIRGLVELGDFLPDPMWTYDLDVDDSAIYSRCAAAVPYFLLAACRGDSQAQLYLGCLYGAGWGVAQDYVAAVGWIRKAAEQGNATAQRQLGTCYEYGEGVAEDPEQAVYWWGRAAERGDMLSQSRLGHAILSNYGLPNDHEKAYGWFRNAAEQGERYAQYQMGEYYGNQNGADGHCTQENREQLFQWRLKAAEQGCVWSQSDVAHSYQGGYGVQEDLEKAVFWHLKVAESAESGTSHAVNAQRDLGRCFHHGKGVENNLSQAVYWYRRAAEKNDESAQLALGKIYEDGEDGKQDFEQAYYWYSRIDGDDADPRIYRKLGAWCLSGTGVRKDKEQAQMWLTKAVKSATKLDVPSYVEEVREFMSAHGLRVLRPSEY